MKKLLIFLFLVMIGCTPKQIIYVDGTNDLNNKKMELEQKGCKITKINEKENFVYEIEYKDSKTDWNLIFINADGIIVTWQEKYGLQKKEECVGLWENKTQYMLTWKDGKKIIIEKSNTNSLEYKNMRE